MSDDKPQTRNLGRCPVCRKPADFEHRPFCSRRCADVDLARWLGGGYVIGGSNLDAADDTNLRETGAQSRPGYDDDEV